MAELASSTIFYLGLNVQSPVLIVVPSIVQVAAEGDYSVPQTVSFLVEEVQETRSSKSPKSTLP